MEVRACSTLPGAIGRSRTIGHIERTPEPWVVVGIELDRGLLISAWWRRATRWWRSTHWPPADTGSVMGPPGAKSDRGDAKVLADLVRTDRHNHRPVAGDSDLAEAIRVLARAHQSAIWSRQRQLNSLRSALRAFYPAALDAYGAAS